MEQTPPAPVVKKGVIAWLKKRLTALLGLVIAIGVIVAVGFLYFNHPDFFDRLKSYGYLGVFVVSIILNATVIIPVSNMTLILAFGATLGMPWLVGIVGGLGGGIGEMTGYLAGRSGRGLLAKNNVYNRVEGWVKKRGWIAIFFLSAFPFVFDVVGIIAGAMRMPFWKFFLPALAGRMASYIVVAYLGSLGFKALPWFG